MAHLLTRQALSTSSQRGKLLARFIRCRDGNDLLVPNQASESHKRFIWRRLRDKKRYFPPLSCTYLVPTSVDVAGTEPATPCLQSKLRNAMWLSRLAFTYVVVHGFGRCLAVCVPTLFPPFSRLHAHSETVYLSHDLHHDAISG